MAEPVGEALAHPGYPAVAGEPAKGMKCVAPCETNPIVRFPTTDVALNVPIKLAQPRREPRNSGIAITPLPPWPVSSIENTVLCDRHERSEREAREQKVSSLSLL